MNLRYGILCIIMARTPEFLMARKIRKRGKSIKDIAKKLKMAKSTISIWCRDIKLSQKLLEKIYVNGMKKSLRGSLLGAETNKKKKMDEMDRCFKEAQNIIKKITIRDLLIAGICLYWAEGAKTGGKFIFVNSDKWMIKIMLFFITNILNINKRMIYCTLQINFIHKKRTEKIMKFWSKYLSIPLSNFRNPYYVKIKPKKKYENEENYYGVLRVGVLKSSKLQYKILGFVDVFKKYADVAQVVRASHS